MFNNRCTVFTSYLHQIRLQYVYFLCNYIYLAYHLYHFNAKRKQKCIIWEWNSSARLPGLAFPVKIRCLIQFSENTGNTQVLGCLKKTKTKKNSSSAIICIIQYVLVKAECKHMIRQHNDSSVWELVQAVCKSFKVKNNFENVHTCPEIVIICTSLKEKLLCKVTSCSQKYSHTWTHTVLYHTPFFSWFGRGCLFSIKEKLQHRHR